MKFREKGIAMAAGILIGTVLVGPAAQAVEQLVVQRSAQSIYVDGKAASFEAYNINGANFVQLRDVGKAVGFEVYWDGEAVQIISGAPYTGEAPPSTEALENTEDYSGLANPTVFTELYTRELYNAAYAVRKAAKAGDFTCSAPFHFSADQDRWRLEGALGDIANGITLTSEAVDPHGGYKLFAVQQDRTVADTATAELMRQAASLRTDREKVRLFNEYLCDRIVYDGKTYEGINEIFTSPSPVNGSCGAFADALNYLCGKAGIPCISVHGESHFWNAVYCDGAWSYVDVSLNDQVSNHAYLLFADSTKKQSSDPEAVAFLKELLVPGSTR